MTIEKEPPKGATPISFEESAKLLTRSERAPDPQKDLTIAALLTRLSAHYPKHDLRAEQVKYFALDYVEDLREFSIPDIERAVRDYRRDGVNKFFPTSGKLRELAEEARKLNRPVQWHDGSKGKREEFGEPRPLFWWLLPSWKPHWREDEIPEDSREAFRKIKARSA